MNRRRFLSGILALGAAPAIVRASSLMPVRRLIMPPPLQIARPDSIVICEDGVFHRYEPPILDVNYYAGEQWPPQFAVRYVGEINIRRPQRYTFNRINSK